MQTMRIDVDNAPQPLETIAKINIETIVTYTSILCHLSESAQQLSNISIIDIPSQPTNIANY